MAFTVHWPNTYTTRVTDKVIGSLAPVLSLQSDTLFPNALAGVTSLLEGSSAATALGCKGNQLDNEFPLAPRIPVALPMIQYPTNTRGPEWQEQDLCALPVLNWKSYIKELHASLAHLSKKATRKRSKSSVTAASADCAEEGKTDLEQALPCETAPEPIKRRRGRPRKTDIKPTPKPKLADQKKYHSEREVREILLHNTVDVEEKEKEPVRRFGFPKKLLTEQPLPKTKFRFQSKRRDSQIPNSCYKKYSNRPQIKVMGTWNYLYGGHGACDWCFDSSGTDKRNLYVGNGAKLRMVTMKPSLSTQMISTSPASVWDEGEVPINPYRPKKSADDPLDNVIYEIKTQKRRNIIAVRRGRSIALYQQQGIPAFLSLIPNICYGTKDYEGWNSKRGCIQHPLLLSFDFNTNSPTELVTLDENRILQFLDVFAERTVNQAKAERDDYYFKPPVSHLGDMDINASGGVAYAGNHPQVIYHWMNSQICLYDSREARRNADTTVLLDLHSPACISWSDEHQSGNSRLGDNCCEYISCLKPSENVLHYYVGTTDRVLLMDMRVPKNPITKFSHGLRGPAAYLDIFNDENYEILVGGCQATSEIFCANFDTTHLSCVERTECKQRNPILQSHPRHLLSSRNFFDFAQEQGFEFSYEADHKRVKDHYDAWCTGLCIMKPTKNFSWKPKDAHPFLLFNSNSFGDIFCQEWHQKPSPPPTRGGADTLDPRLTSFMKQWKSSMESTELREFYRPSRNPHRSVDCDLLIQSSAHSLKHSRKVRTQAFDPFTPSTLIFNRVRDGLPSLDEQVTKLRTINSQRVQRFLDVWTENLDDEEGEENFPSAASTHENTTEQIDRHVVDEDSPSRESPQHQPAPNENQSADFDEMKEEIEDEFLHETRDTDVEMSDNEDPFGQIEIGLPDNIDDILDDEVGTPSIDISSLYFEKSESEPHHSSYS